MIRNDCLDQSFVNPATIEVSDNTTKLDGDLAAKQYETSKTSAAIDNDIEKSLVEFGIATAPKGSKNGN